jgi:uncharacterized damage-inducible protein DinB
MRRREPASVAGLIACRRPNGRGKVRLLKGEATAAMTKDDIQLLYEYHRWAKNRALHTVSTFNAEKFTRDLGGSFRSVRDTLVHITGSQWAWLTYWKELSPSSAFLADLWTREFVNRVTNESLQRMLPVCKTQISLAHLMQHLANHSTYHRGQVALMIRQLAAKPLATDFAMFLMEGASEADYGVRLTPKYLSNTLGRQEL